MHHKDKMLLRATQEYSLCPLKLNRNEDYKKAHINDKISSYHIQLSLKND